MKSCIFITEARDAELEYEEKKKAGEIDRIVVELSGKKSEIATKLAKEFKDVKELEEKLKEKKNELNLKATDHVISFFDAADEVYTRVVETVSVVLTVSKQVQTTIPETKTFDFDGFYSELLTVVPDLKDKLELLVKTYTTITPEVSVPADKKPSLRVKLKEDSFSEKLSEKLKELGSKVFNFFIRWGYEYDRKLEKIKDKYLN